MITPLGSELVVNVDGTIKAVNASYFERRRSFPLQPYALRISLAAQAALKKPSATATSAIEDDLHISDADDEDGRRGRCRSREQRDTSVARREMSSSDRDRQSSAASSRGESRRRSGRRSPSGSRNRRKADWIQPDVIPEVEDRRRVARKLEISSMLSSPSGSDENINVLVQRRPSQPAVIAATQPR